MTSAPPLLSRWRRVLVVAVALVVGVVVADIVVARPLTHASVSTVVAVSPGDGRSDSASSTDAVYVYDGTDASALGSVSVAERSHADQGVRGLGDRRHGSSRRYDDPANIERASARLDGYRLAPNTARLAQDIAVSPTVPRALRLNRPVGASATQNRSALIGSPGGVWWRRGVGGGSPFWADVMTGAGPMTVRGRLASTLGEDLACGGVVGYRFLG